MPRLIAYPGVTGSFSAAAAAAAFPGDTCEGFPTFPEAAQAVTEGRADYAVIPVENSFAGAVSATYQLLERLPLHIVGETTRRVRHQLLGLPGSRLEDIRIISSHPQAIAQCDAFLATMKGVQLITSANTAISARELRELGDSARAAIASEAAARAFGLETLAHDIETSKNNTTRFLILSAGAQPLAKPDKATVVFTVNDRVGALVQVLISFAISGLNMSRIESRPIPDTPFAYAFLADFEGPMDEEHLTAAMEAARPFARDLRLLGIYPKNYHVE